MGKNQMQFGGRYRHERFQYLPDRQADTDRLQQPGQPHYSSRAPAPTTAPTPTPAMGRQASTWAARISYTVQLEPPVPHYHDMEFDAYFQDNWHVSRNLTLNLGGRYEAHPAAWTKNGLTQGFDLKNDALVLTNPTSYYITNGYTTQAIITNLTNIGVKFETPGDRPGYQDVMINNYNLTFSPRVGIAWQPFGGKHGTVVRGAYGRYIYPVPVRNSIRNTATGVPFAQSYAQSFTSCRPEPGRACQAMSCGIRRRSLRARPPARRAT